MEKILRALRPRGSRKSHLLALNRTKLHCAPRSSHVLASTHYPNASPRAAHSTHSRMSSRQSRSNLANPGQTFWPAEGRRQKTGGFLYGAMCYVCRYRMPVKPRQTGSNQFCPRWSQSHRGHRFAGASHPDANTAAVRRLILFQFFICAGGFFW